VSQDARLTTSEFLLRRELRSSTASPFIAHATLTEKSRNGLVRGVRDFVSGSASRIPRLFDIYPASAAWLIGRTLLENYGLESHRIYEPIARSFAVAEIPTSVRQPLNQAFRKACSKLGLIIAGGDAGGWVDDYVLQAGVAKSQLRTLIEAFVRAEAVIGLPPEEDTRRLNAWEVRAADFAPHGFTRLRNIMRWDESAYHAGVYARARRGGSCETSFETDVSAVLRSVLDDTNFRRTAADEPLRILFVEDTLVLAAPAATGVILQLPDREKRLGAGRRLNLSPPWPVRISWRREDDDSSHVEQLIDDAAPLALFDVDTGSLLKRLGPSDSAKPVPLDVSEVLIAARRPFRAAGLASIDIGPSAHALIITLGTGAEVEVANCRFMLKPPLRPLIEVVATKVGRGTHGPLLTRPTELRVAFTGGRPEGNLMLRAEHPALATALSLQLPPGDMVSIPFEDALPAHGPVGPLRISLGFGEDSRVLVRASNWVWPGLRRLEGGSSFDGPAPDNLDLLQSRHIVRDSSGRISLDVSESYRCASLTFWTADGRSAHFEVSRPGTSMAIVDEDGRERPLQPGSALPLLPTTAGSLVIRSDDIDAALDIRGTVHPKAFGKSGVRRIALASLVGPASHNELRLWPRGDQRQCRTLLELSPATMPHSFGIERDRRTGQLRIDATFECLVDAAKLVVRDLAGGPDQEVEAELGRRPVSKVARDLLDGDVQVYGTSRCSVSLRAAAEHRWSALAIGHLSVRREGEEKWSPLRNARGDDYPLLLAAELPWGELIARDDMAHTIFLRLTDVLNRCHAAESWDTLQKLQRFWVELGAALSGTQRGRETLLESWARPVPVDSNQSWVPLRHPIEVAPNLLSTEILNFHVMEDAGDDFAELGNLRRIAELERVQDALGHLSITPTFYTAFDNFMFAAANPKARLLCFDVAKYVANSASGETDLAIFWKPADGRLTPRHHAWCVGRFIDRFEQAAPAGLDDNALRTQRLNKLVHTVPRSERRNALPVSERLADRLTLVNALPAFVCTTSKAARWGKSEEHWRLLTKSSGCPLEEVLHDVGFLLRLAPELFAFYLLLWELVWRTDPDE
jgi:hypothetical protein